MKHHYNFFSLFMAAALFAGCSTETDDLDFESSTTPSQSPTFSTSAFAPDDGARPLQGSPANMVLNLLLKVGPDVAKELGYIQITDEQYAEIKTFTDDLVKDSKTDAKKYNTIFKWIVKNIEYARDYVDNDPYPVFQTRRAVCQGFANLLHVMLHTQGIPTLNVNGEYSGVGGHAWNYVYHSNKWWVSDPTNNGQWSMLSTNQYKHLIPFSIDANLYETDDCVFVYKDCEINIDRIKTEKEQFVVPFSIGGYKVTALSPSQPVPTCIKEIFIGKNITTLGEYYKGLDKNAPSIEKAYVSPENERLESFDGIVYKKNGEEKQVYYIPASLRKVELLPMRILDKNTFFEHNNIQEVIIPNGTEEICDYAFEKCPYLRIAYIPESTKVSEKAFYDVHPDFTIVRGDYTGIPEITL